MKNLNYLMDHKGVIFKNCALFTNCDDAEYIDVVTPMHNLTEHSDNY